MSQKVKALTAIPAVPDRTRDPQTTFNAKTVAWMEAQKRNTDDFNVNVPALNELFTVADDALDAAEEAVASAATATLKAGEAAASAQSALESKEAAQTARTGAETARTGAEAARDAAVAVAGVDIATTEKAGLVKPDGVSLKMKDAAGKVAVEDVLYNGSISLVNSGALGKAKYIKLSDHFNVDEDDFDLVLVQSVGHGGTYPPWIKNNFIYIKQFYYSRNSETDIGNRMQIAFGYGDSSSGQRYCRGGAWSAWVRTIKETDLATTTTPGVIKVGRGLDASGDGTLRYAGMSAATLSVGGTTRLNAASARNLVLTATVASPSVFLPSPSTLFAGEQFTFFAEGDNIQVRDFQGQAVGPVLARGKAYLFTLINKTTGEWARAEFSASGTSGENGGSLGFQPSISAPVIFSDVAERYSVDIELETGRVLHFGSTASSSIPGGTLSLVSVTGWGAVSVKNTPLTLPQDFILHDFLKLSSSLCCALAKDTTTNKKFAVIPVDVSGATAVVGVADILTTTGTLGKFIFSRVDDAHALLVYGDGTALYARLYSFSGSTITAATPVLVREASSGDINKLNVQRMDDTRWLLWTGGFDLQLLEVSGTAVTVGEPVTFTPDASWTSSAFNAVSPAPGGDVLVRFTYSYKKSVLQTVTVYALLVYTSSGLVLTKGTSTEIPDTYQSASFLNIAGRMFLWGQKSNSYYLVPVTVGNGTATAGAECLIFATSANFYKNLTLLTYTGDTYAIMSVYERDDSRIYFLRGGFTISPDGSLTKVDPSGPATSISNITWGRNPCIQAFPGGRYVYSVGDTRKQNTSDGSSTTVGFTTVRVLDSSFTKLCEASVDGFVSKPYSSSWIFTSSPYLYPSVFPTGEYQTLVILNQYDSQKPAWALFTL